MTISKRSFPGGHFDEDRDEIPVFYPWTYYVQYYHLGSSLSHVLPIRPGLGRYGGRSRDLHPRLPSLDAFSRAAVKIPRYVVCTVR